MARTSSKSSGNTRNRREDASPSRDEGTEGPVTPGHDAVAPGDSVDIDQDSALAQSAPGDVGMEPLKLGDDPIIDAVPIAEDTTPDIAPDDGRAKAPPPAPPQPPEPAPSRAGLGFLPMVLGGLVAAGIGYGAAYLGWLPKGDSPPTQTAEIAQALAPLQEQIAALAAAASATPQPAAPVDLSPVLDQIAALSTRLDATTSGIEALSTRLGALEDRPVLTGDADADAIAALAAADTTAAALAAELEAERAATAARTAELEAEARTAAAAAAAAIASAETATARALARADAEAALGEVQAAIATGAPFAAPLSRIAAVTEAPEALSGAAQTGVATLASLQAAFPPLARAALPIALQETAGEGLGERLGAFVMGQIGGRSVAPRAGDDPDAVLSRVEAAVRSGDLAAALAEIAALPDGAKAILAPWVADVQARAAAEAGLAALTAALGADSN